MPSTERLIIPCLLLASLTVIGCSASSSDDGDVRVDIEPSMSPKCKLAIEKTFEAENRLMEPICAGGGGGGGAGGGGGGGGAGGTGSGDLGGELEGKLEGY